MTPFPSAFPRAVARAACLLAALALAGPWAAAQEGRPAPAVTVAPAETSDLRPSAGFTGRLVATQKIDIRARVPGFLEEIGFAEGAILREGALVYRIEADAYRAEVEQIRGAIASAEAELRLAEIERDRKAQLVERQTIAQSELDVALANLGKVEGEIKRLKGQLARAELDVAYTEITAPFDGVVGLTRFDIGAYVGPESGALTTLTRLDPMSVEFPVASALLLNYRDRTAGSDAAGETAVSLVLPNGAVYDHPGRIDFIDAEVAPGTDTVTVRAVFDNPDGILLDGGLVRVELEAAEESLVLSVPQQAVARDQVGAFVMVVGADSAVEMRRVEVARVTRGRSVIRSGLEEGELVITEGLNKVRPGITVDAAMAQSAASGG